MEEHKKNIFVERQKITDSSRRCLLKISAFMPEGRALFLLNKL
jgi:hypothetical protein